MRQCGECTLCCTLLPVKPLGKRAGQKCVHQRFRTGCAVYHKPGMPHECKAWNCRWLVGDDTQDLKRPDKSHYVIDLLPDVVALKDNQFGHVTELIAVQIWIDPDFPDAHQDPALRSYIERRARDGQPALIRYDTKKALTIFAPPLSADQQWHEIMSEADPDYRGLWT